MHAVGIMLCDADQLLHIQVACRPLWHQCWTKDHHKLCPTDYRSRSPLSLHVQLHHQQGVQHQLCRQQFEQLKELKLKCMTSPYIFMPLDALSSVVQAGLYVKIYLLRAHL